MFVLPVPYRPQIGPTANRKNNDCGAAALGMALDYYRRPFYTVDQLALETTLADYDTGLMPYQLMNLAARHGLSTGVITATADRIRAEVQAGRPVIPLIAYRFLRPSIDCGHFVTVIGTDGDGFIIHDPDYSGVAGARLFIPADKMLPAIIEYGSQCLFMETQVSVSDQIIEHANAIIALSTQVDTPPPTDPVGAIMYVTSKTGLNVRTMPNTSGAVVGGLRYGDTVRVIDATVNGQAVAPWKQITEGTYRSYYVSGDYLAVNPTLRPR